VSHGPVHITVVTTAREPGTLGFLAIHLHRRTCMAKSKAKPKRAKKKPKTKPKGKMGY